MNRPGGDYEHFPVNPADPKICADECADDPFCRAYTYVSPGVQGSAAHCWLKHIVPPATTSPCCRSGVLKTPPRYDGTSEADTDMPGSDYASAILATADPTLCRAACARDENCQAYTYVKPGIQHEQAVCYLKEAVTARTPNPCCISGIKRSSLTHFTRYKDTDLPGQDYNNFLLPHGGALACQEECSKDAECKAFTYVKSSLSMPDGRCWLKRGKPTARASACCESGAKIDATLTFSTLSKGNFDLPGQDYHHFTVGKDETELCRAACGADGTCRAFTFVKPGVQGASAVCYLKDKVPAGANNTCCISGAKSPAFIGKPVGPEQGKNPLYLEFSPNSSQNVITGLPFPEDMPPVRFPSSYDKCDRGQIEMINRSWALAHHHLWRAHQVMQHINRRDRHRDTLWIYGFVDRMANPGGGYANWSPRGWFGSYKDRRFRMSRRAIEKVFTERFRGKTFKVACRIDENNQGPHPCHIKKKDDPSANHILYGKINFCNDFFEQDEVPRAKLIIHEVFHWLKIPKSAYWVSDGHDFWRSCGNYEAARALYNDLAAFIALNRGCRDWNYNRTVINNDNYAWFARQIGERVYRGLMRRFPAEDFDWIE